MDNTILGFFLEAGVMFIILWMIFFMLKMIIDYQRVKTGEKKGTQHEGKPMSEEEIKKYLATRDEPLNLVLMILLLIFIMFVIHFKTGFEMTGTNEDYPVYFLAGLPIIFLAFTAIYNVIFYIFGKEKKRRWGLASETNSLTDKKRKKIDFQRKIFHLVAFILISIFIFYGYPILKGSAEINPTYDIYVENYWGEKDGLGFVERIFKRESMPFAKSILIMFTYGQALLLLIFETTRLSKKLFFPMQKLTQAIMRYKEIDTFAALSHYAIGYLFAAICMPPLLFLASMCLITFADPASSTIGIHHGTKIFKKRFSWNGKSWEGTIVGCFAAFITMFIFVGPIYSLVGAIVFFIIDLSTPKPIKLSDNISMPVILTFAFIILSVAGIPCQNYLGI